MNVKPGDLAYVTWAYVPTNVGMVVEVLNECCEHLGQFCWLTKAARAAPTLDYLFDSVVGIGNAETAFVADAHLRPILPPPGTVTDEEVRDLYAPKQTEPA